ncbi:MAG: hypothetical protein L3J84_08360 [Gammaproteobacteria bacterium]|nr:hypothetical protein [Gammaproteobacteria bacterium]
MNPVPLLIVMGTILALLAVQRWLVHIGSPRNKNLHKENIPLKPKKTPAQLPAITQPDQKSPHQHGRKLTEGLSVTGLDERGIDSLKALINKKETDAISTFLAFNRPVFMEIDTCLAQQRQQKENETPPSSTQARLTKLLEPLTKTERKLLIEFNPKSTRLISRDLMSRFGGHEFGIYFGHYAARPQSVTLHIPPLDPDRKILEDLAKSRIARKGRHIPLNARLTVLKMSQLRQMAKDLNLDKKFTRKQVAAETLATVPGAAVLLSMQYVIDDLFMLMPIKEDVVLVKHEWSYLQAYAKMLSGLKL